MGSSSSSWSLAGSLQRSEIGPAAASQSATAVPALDAFDAQRLPSALPPSSFTILSRSVPVSNAPHVESRNRLEQDRGQAAQPAHHPSIPISRGYPRTLPMVLRCCQACHTPSTGRRDRQPEHRRIRRGGRRWEGEGEGGRAVGHLAPHVPSVIRSGGICEGCPTASPCLCQVPHVLPAARC